MTKRVSKIKQTSRVHTFDGYNGIGDFRKLLIEFLPEVDKKFKDYRVTLKGKNITDDQQSFQIYPNIETIPTPGGVKTKKNQQVFNEEASFQTDEDI